MQTNVKLSPNSLTSPTQPPPSSHPTLSQLSLLEFQKKFVPLPTMKKTHFIGQNSSLHVPFSIVSLIFQSFTMGQVTSLYGKTMGKIGSIVFSTSGGKTIAREYNPHVANPNTMAQINQRARMKLMSQLSASLSPVIAMRKEGLTSARNKFVQKNFGASYASEGVAQISYENVQLTSGNSALPQIKWVSLRDSDIPTITAFFSDEPSANISRVVWCLFRKTDEGKLELVTSIITSQRGESGSGTYFTVSFPNIPLTENTGVLEYDYVIYAYGMSDTSERATARYGNLNVQSATDIARLIATRTISFEDYQFTQTRGTSANRGDSQSTDVPAGSARVYVTALGEGGTVSGGGVFEVGTQVTVTATPAAQYAFRAWVKNGSSQVVSTSATYTFTLNEQTDLIAQFDFVGNETL